MKHLLYGNERKIRTRGKSKTRSDDALDDDENLELHMVDYSIGYNVIYAVFSWSVADEAYELMRSLAQKHKVGFFDVSGDDGDIILPDGIMIK